MIILLKIKKSRPDYKFEKKLKHDSLINPIMKQLYILMYYQIY